MTALALLDPYGDYAADASVYDDAAERYAALSEAGFDSLTGEIGALLTLANAAPFEDVRVILERVAELETARAGGFIGTNPDARDDVCVPW